MPKRILKAIGGLKPRKPKLSLPSYQEPTPETSQKLTREQEADFALTRTKFTAGTRVTLVALFLATIASVPVIQLAADLRRGGSLPMPEMWKALPTLKEIAAVRGARDLWNLLPHAEELKAAEKSLESDSVVSQWLLPSVQALLVGKLRAASEQVYLGRDGWLFYRPDVDYVTGPPFLSRARLKQQRHAASIQPDPVKAIVHFRDQLAARGIELIVLPVPTKPTVEGEWLSEGARRGEPLQNPSFAEFEQELKAAGVRMFDPVPALMARKAAAGTSLYLEADTHWLPETMEFVAEQLAAFSNLPAPVGEKPPPFVERAIVGPAGDIARMLKLPDDQQLYLPQRTRLRQVMAGNGLWRPSRDADVLLLGDSFANIFSLNGLGWGEGAGLAEHLSLALGGRPLDCILRNSDGAFATREMLARELTRGRDRLAGKKLVIWEFAARELAFGNWKLLDLKLGSPAPARFFSPAPGTEIEVTGTIEAVSSVPRPGSVPYKDHVMAVHLTELNAPGMTGALQAVVYLASMRDNLWTSAARLRAGDQLTVKLRAWSEVAARYEQVNRSEVEDPELQLEDPVWGELTEGRAPARP